MTEGSENDRKIYKPYSVVEESIKILNNLNGEKLKESAVPDLVSTAYSRIKEELLKEIEKYKGIALELFETLQPLKKTESEEHFYRMFQGLEVVPKEYYEKAIEAAEKGRGIEIYRYLVPIPYWKYFALQNKFGNVFEYDSRHRITVANLKYSSEHGLLDETETNVEII